MRIRIIYGAFVEFLPSAVLESNQVTNATIREVQVLMGVLPQTIPYLGYRLSHYKIPNLFLVEVFSELVSDVVTVLVTK